MSLKITVTNEPPIQADSTDNINPDLLAHFREYMEGASIWPFKHQADAFAAVLADQQLRLVAGTAAGKTLAVALPLFHKMFGGVMPRPRKILFMYPTRALLEDQRQVMVKLAEVYAEYTRERGLEPEQVVGLIQGGMNRTALFAALACPALVATPDAIYWFFRKNVKYSHVLIYALCQVSEVVVDEAHLFNGLMLENLIAMLNRVRFFRHTYMKANLKVHYLSATADEALIKLNSDTAAGPVVRIDGRSKCGDVITFIEEQPAITEADKRLMSAAQELLDTGKQRVLLVCNSASRAHKIFDKVKPASAYPSLPPKFSLRYGLITLERGISLLGELNLGEAIVQRFERNIRVALPLRWRDLPEKSRDVSIQAEALESLLAEQLSAQHRTFRNALWKARDVTDKQQINIGKLKATLSSYVIPGSDSLLMFVFDNYFSEPQRGLDNFDLARGFLDKFFEQLSAWTSGVLDRYEEGLTLSQSSGESLGLNAALRQAAADQPALLAELGSIEPLVRWISETLRQNLMLDKNTMQRGVDLPLTLYTRRKGRSKNGKPRSISVGWLLRILKESLGKGDADELLDRFRDLVLARGEIEHGYVKSMADAPPGTSVLLYTGSMTDRSRAGLLDVFKDSDQRATGQPMLLISTSAVEVGVDFDADAMISEISEKQGSNLLQRFGRVGRREGVRSEVRLFMPTTAVDELAERLSGIKDIDRSEFSTLVRDLLPPPSYVDTSDYLKAIHHLVNQQIGEVGEEYNQHLESGEDYTAVQQIANAMQAKGIDFAYGLRDTLPAISLRDAGVSRDPFYLLSYVEDDELLASESPFEAGMADLFFGEFIYRRRLRNVYIDSRPTIEAATHQIWRKRSTNELRVLEVDLAVGSDEHKKMMDEALCEPLLLYGDIYLAACWLDSEGKPTGGKPEIGGFSLTNQWYVLLPGVFDTCLDDVLKQADCFELEEIYYDRLGAQREHGYGAILLERQTGAAFHVWQRLSAEWKALKQLRATCKDSK